MVVPGETRTQTVNLPHGVSAAGITALNRNIDHAEWRASARVADSGPTHLTLYIGTLASTLTWAKPF